MYEILTYDHCVGLLMVDPRYQLRTILTIFLGEIRLPGIYKCSFL